MNKTNVETMVKDVTRELMELGYLVEKGQVKKNGVLQDTLMVKKPHGLVAQTIYLSFIREGIEKGYDEHDFVDEITSGKDTVSFIEDNLYQLNYFDVMKSYIVTCVIKKEGNDGFLQDIPHTEMLDLAVYFRCMLDDITGSFIITNNILNLWGKTVSDLQDAAKKNVSRWLPEIKYICEMLGMLGIPTNNEDIPEIPMYVVTNEKHLYAASILANKDGMGFLERKFGEFYILPSSIHEILVIPGKFDEEKKKDFDEMVREVNRKEVIPEEVLVDHAYYYSKGKIYM